MRRGLVGNCARGGRFSAEFTRGHFLPNIRKFSGLLPCFDLTAHTPRRCLGEVPVGTSPHPSPEEEATLPTALGPEWAYGFHFPRYFLRYFPHVQ